METENDQQIEELGSRTRLYLATLSVNFLYVSAGSTQAWTSPTLPKLVNILTPDEASLVGSLYSFGAAFGPIIGALCLNSLGRKGTLYVLGGCFLISWIILAPTYNVYVLYVGRFIGGIGVGGTLSCAAMYLAEVADKKSRGPINSINHTSLALGCLIEYAVGPWTSYLTLILVSGLSAILFFITFFFIPESFYYLLIKERKQEAIESLRWFRGNISETSVQKELNEIKESIRIRQENKDGWKTMLQRGPLISLCICFYLLTIEQGSGNTAIVGFAQLIFEEAHVAVSGAMIPIIGSVAIFFAGLLSPFIVNRFSMKIAFIFSSFGVAFALGLMAIFFYLDSIGKAVPAVSFLPVLGFVLYKVFFCWGCGPLPWAITAELFPLKVKGLATSLCGIYYSLIGFAVIELTGIYLNRSGPTLVFTGLFFFLTITTAAVIFILPDTTGLSLQEVHDYMQSGKRPQKSDVKT